MHNMNPLKGFVKGCVAAAVRTPGAIAARGAGVDEARAGHAMHHATARTLTRT